MGLNNCNNMSLPRNIERCPIIDALVEIRFETALNPNAVFGLIYGALMDDYPGKVENLPILQVPEAVRKNDPALKFKPLYKIINKDITLQIGNDVLSISSSIPYIGWEAFQKHISKIISVIYRQKIINRVTRLGHRYVNFFDSDILDKVTMSFQMTEGYLPENVQIITQVQDGDFKSTIQFSNAAIFNDLGIQKEGTIIDIDTFRNYERNEFLENIVSEVNSAHIAEKKLFFSLLKPEFIRDLNPSY